MFEEGKEIRDVNAETSINVRHRTIQMIGHNNGTAVFGLTPPIAYKYRSSRPGENGPEGYKFVTWKGIRIKGQDFYDITDVSRDQKIKKGVEYSVNPRKLGALVEKVTGRKYVPTENGASIKSRGTSVDEGIKIDEVDLKEHITGTGIVDLLMEENRKEERD